MSTVSPGSGKRVGDAGTPTLRSLAIIAGVGVLVVVLSSLLGSAMRARPKPSPSETVSTSADARTAGLPEAPTTRTPQYEVVSVNEPNIGKVRRVSVKVVLPEHYTQDKVEQVARHIVYTETKKKPLNAISMLFYGPNTSTSGSFDIALVEWAPNGQWGDAGSVQAGDYSSFRYAVTYHAPVAAPKFQRASGESGSPQPSGLRRSPRVGLLGVPLPEGARLVERTPGDRAAGRDPSEKYAIAASAAAISEFYRKEMLTDGWKINATSSASLLVYEKAGKMIGILLSKEGRAFTLWGS